VFCISCSSPLDAGVTRLAESLGAQRVICAACLALYAERPESVVQMNVRIPVELDAELREAARESRVPYAKIVRDRLQRVSQV